MHTARSLDGKAGLEIQLCVQPFLFVVCVQEQVDMDGGQKRGRRKDLDEEAGAA